MSSPRQEDFFDEPQTHSRVKARIVSKYVQGWARILTDFLRRSGKTVLVVYADLFCGPGAYNDGTASTPMLVLKNAIEDPKLRLSLMTFFNDNDSANVNSLKEEIAKLPDISVLAFAPALSVKPATLELVRDLKIPGGAPQLFFMDPFGYKQLSIELLRYMLEGWAECIFFFNYRRVIAAIENPVMSIHMVNLFGEIGLKKLRDDLGISVGVRKREAIVLTHLEAALKRAGAKHVLTFAFKVDDSHRSTHHLIFLTKHDSGYKLMKQIMASESSESNQGVPSMGYVQRVQTQSLFPEDPLKDLENRLKRTFCGRSVTVEQIFREDSPGSNFIPSNYQTVLLSMEKRELVIVDPPAAKRRSSNGKLSMALTACIKFRREYKDE